MTNGGITMLKEMLPTLPPSEKKIASYLIENPHESLSLTANELGKRCLASGTAVIRLCKSLDLKGFQDLKMRIAGDLQQTEQQGVRDIEANEPVLSIIQKMTNNTVQTIRETAELLYTDELQNAVEAITRAKRIHFIGIGASGIIAEDAKQKFLRINKVSYACTDMHLAATQVANAEVDDVVMGISFSGQTTDVAKVLRLAKENGVTTISLTKYGKSPVTEQADIRLYTSATKEPTFRSGATLSRIAQLQVIDILFMCVATLNYDETVKHLNKTREAIEWLTNGTK